MDDDNSHAEGANSNEGAVGFSHSRIVGDAQSTQRLPNASQNDAAANPHYENIYESLDQYNAPALAAAAPANAVVVPPPSGAPIAAVPTGGQHHDNCPLHLAGPSGVSRSFPPNNKRHDQYERTVGYDVPRQMFRNIGAGPSNNYQHQRITSASAPSSSTSTRRANLHLDLNPNRPRYTTASRPHRQRSFDDTESAHYNNFRYENIYEQIHEEPIYRNISSLAPSNPANRVYSRLGVIGHGIGRIERHLSSSCGNIDHYNLGGHYAVLGHSHLGTVGHIRLNAESKASGNAKPGAKESGNGGKSLNLFSCISRENSQSLTNIHRATSGNPNSTAPTSNAQPTGAFSGNRHATGAIPKTPKPAKSQKSNEPNTEPPEKEHTSTLNRMSKSSLHWLLINKWLPMWIGQEPDYNILDFNFMFSRNCHGCGDTHSNREQSVVRFNGHAEMSARIENDIARRSFAVTNENGSASLRPMRLNHSWTRLRECEHGPLARGPSPYDRYRDDYYDQRAASRKRGESTRREADPFRNWELNIENNSFRPAGAAAVAQPIRRITDGTFPAPGLIRQGSSTESRGQAAIPNMERLVAVEHVGSQEPEGAVSTTYASGGRRYSDNTEDDQHTEDQSADQATGDQNPTNADVIM